MYVYLITNWVFRFMLKVIVYFYYDCGVIKVSIDLMIEYELSLYILIISILHSIYFIFKI